MSTPDANGWMPIEGAPRDGTRFLAYGSYRYPGDEGRTEYQTIVEYSGEPEWPWTDENGHNRIDVFSHWQPLPLSPTQGEEA